MNEKKRYIVWWNYQTGWAHDIFHSREEAVKFAETKAASLPGKSVGLFEEVAQVTVAVNPVTTWKEVEKPKEAPPMVPPELLEKIPAKDPKIELYPVGCNNRLRAEGKASPRTCAVCRLGPCMGAVHTP